MNFMSLIGLAVANRWLPFELYEYWSWQGKSQPFLGDPESFLSFAGAVKVKSQLNEKMPRSPSFFFVIDHVNPDYKAEDRKVMIEEFARDLSNLLVSSPVRQESLLLIIFMVGENACIFYRGAAVKRLITDAVVDKALNAAREDFLEKNYDLAFEKLMDSLPRGRNIVVEETLMVVGFFCIVAALIACLKGTLRRPRRRQEDVYHRPDYQDPWPARPTPFSAPATVGETTSAPAQATPFSNAVNQPIAPSWPAQATPFTQPANVGAAQATPFSGANQGQEIAILPTPFSNAN